MTLAAPAVLSAQDPGFDLFQTLFLILFFAIPLIGRVFQALRKQQEAKSRPPGAPPSPTPRERVEELEREGDEAWRRLFEEPAEEAESQTARPAPVAPRAEAMPPRKPISLEDLGRGLETEAREISYEREGAETREISFEREGAEAREVSLEREGAESAARQTLVPDLASVGPESEAFAAFGGLGRPIGTGEAAPALESAVPEPARRPRVAALLASSGWSWRSAVLAAEILGPPLASRRPGGALGEPSAAFARPVFTGPTGPAGPGRLPPRAPRRRGAG